ncbi:MAG: prephenate dehydrogenase/arogenate dehydrogenase family protein [Verrucomicrobia bacterium]|nr:prephenate dehydrogenase/arogenate dehydrogenase family protein [Verrucomicrobiota bacterium]
MTDGGGGRKPAIGVAGAGLIGGSIALAAHERGFPVTVYDPYADLAGKIPEGITVAPDLTALTVRADIVLLATPLGALAELGRQLAGLVTHEVVVSDVGSVKGDIARGLAAAFAGRAEYVPSHPMAGSEQHGWAAARGSMFEGTTVIVCPEFALKPASVERLEAFWRALGGRTMRLSVAEHDCYVAAVSHLPHALAAALVELIGAEIPGALSVVGPGFRDTTRIASGAPRLWTEILLANRLAVADYLEMYGARLARLRTALAECDHKYLEGLLDAGKRNRDKLNF